MMKQHCFPDEAIKSYCANSPWHVRSHTKWKSTWNGAIDFVLGSRTVWVFLLSLDDSNIKLYLRLKESGCFPQIS